MQTRKKSFLLWGAKALAPALLLAGMCSLAQGGVILLVNGGTVTDDAAPEPVGESFTTPTGGPWNNIAFNFFAPDGSPLAVGTAYLLTQEYSGPVSGIGSAAGLLASTSTIFAKGAGEAWLFDPSVVLNSNTQYWLYEDTPITITGASFAGIPSQEAYFGVTGNYQLCDCEAPGLANFELDAVPEPGTWLSGLTGLAALGAIRLRGRKSARRA